MALVAIGALSLEDVEALWTPKDAYSPVTTDEERQRERARWSAVVQRVEKTIPELSTVSF
jgi:glycerol kinase